MMRLTDAVAAYFVSWAGEQPRQWHPGIRSGVADAQGIVISRGGNDCVVLPTSRAPEWVIADWCVNGTWEFRGSGLADLTLVGSVGPNAVAPGRHYLVQDGWIIDV